MVYSWLIDFVLLYCVLGISYWYVKIYEFIGRFENNGGDKESGRVRGVIVG